MKTIKKIQYYMVPILLLIVSFATVFSQTIWADEAYSLELAKHSYMNLIKIDALDVHPPLYYIILRTGFLIFGVSENFIWIGRFVSLVPYVILMIIGFTVIKKRYSKTIAYLFNVFIMGMPQMLRYSTEIRMYSWGMLFVTCAFLQMKPIVEKNKFKSYVMLTLFSALASYTHYFACVSAIVIYAEIILMFFRKKENKKIIRVLLSGMGVAVLYLPWLLIFVKQLLIVKEDYWIGPVSIHSIIQNFLFLFSTNIRIIEIVSVTIVGIGMFGAIRALRKRKNYEAVCGITIWLGTIILGICLSLLIRPIFVSRYVMSAAACMWLGISIGISEIDNKRINRALVYTITIIGIILATDYIKNELNDKSATNYTLSELEKNIDSETVILSNYNHVQRVISYFYPQNNNIVIEDELSELTEKVYEECKLEKIENIDEIKKYQYKNRILVLDSNGLLIEELNKINCQLNYLGSYKLDRYSFETYIIEQ